MSRSRFTLAFDHHNMVPAPEGDSTPQTIFKSEDGILLAYGTSVPDTANTYAPGCIFIHVDGSDNNSLYVNNGTYASPDFEKVINVNNVLTEIEAEHLSGSASGRGPSPNIWDDAKILQIMLDPTIGWHYFNDFVNAPELGANASVYDNGIIGAWTGATGGKITGVADELGGVIQLFTTDDNDCTGLVVCSSNGKAGLAKFAANKTLYFETRLKVSNITDSKFGLFVGFGEEALTGATGVIGDDGALADKDLVGFHRLEADGDKFDTRHNTAGGGGITTVKADAITLVADTYVKLGIKLSGSTVTFYKDGAALDDTVAITATNFPDGEEMAIYIVLKAAADDDAKVEVDWIRAAQIF